MGTTTVVAGLGTSQIEALRALDSPENQATIRAIIAAAIEAGTQTNIIIVYDPDTGTFSYTAEAGGGGGGPGGDVFGPANSADGELPLFTGTTGKSIARSNALSGFIQLTAGVVSALTAGQFKTALSLVKGDVGLGNVDNTSDANKPVSTPQQNALDGKLDKGGGIMTGNLTLVGPATSALQPVSLQQFSDAIEGLPSKVSAEVRTAAALPSCTYNNGASGVGATLTANANGALPAQDGITLSVGQYIAVGDQATQQHNGLFVLTQLGDSTHPWILTRATVMDKDAEFAGAYVFVKRGTFASRFLYSTVVGAFTVGTTAFTWGASTSTLGSTDALPEGSTNLYFTASRVLSQVLGGLNLTVNAAITSADSVLSAFGKLQKQITDALTSIATKANTASPSFTGVMTHPGADIVAGVAVSGNAIDFAVGLNEYTFTGNATCTFAGSPANYQATVVRLIGGAADYTLTFPVGSTIKSRQRQATVTAITVPAGYDGEMILTKLSTGVFALSGEPMQTPNLPFSRTQKTGAAETKTLCAFAPCPGIIRAIYGKTSAGTENGKVRINGTDVTGASCTAATTRATGTATAANTFARGDVIDLVYSSPSSAADVDFTVEWTPLSP